MLTWPDRGRGHKWAKICWHHTCISSDFNFSLTWAWHNSSHNHSSFNVVWEAFLQWCDLMDFYANSLVKKGNKVRNKLWLPAYFRCFIRGVSNVKVPAELGENVKINFLSLNMYFKEDKRLILEIYFLLLTAAQYLPFIRNLWKSVKKIYLWFSLSNDRRRYWNGSGWLDFSPNILIEVGHYTRGYWASLFSSFKERADKLLTNNW